MISNSTRTVKVLHRSTINQITIKDSMGALLNTQGLIIKGMPIMTMHLILFRTGDPRGSKNLEAKLQIWMKKIGRPQKT